MKKLLFSMLFISTLSLTANASEGTQSVKSAHSVAQTADRLENILKEKGMTLFKRVYHSQAAKLVGVELPDMELIIFGNPKVGSPLMRCQPGVAIDLPQKMLIHKDSNQQVWLTYNDPSYLQARHDIKGCEKILGKISKALNGIAKAAGAQ